MSKLNSMAELSHRQLGPVGSIDFEWPEYNSDNKRIKEYSKKYKDLSISDAFRKHYNINLNNISEWIDQVPKEIKVGDIIKTRVLSVDKSDTILDSSKFKYNIQSNVNLFKYEKFRQFLPVGELSAVVTRVEKNKVVVDPITPIVNEWLEPILQDPNSQKIVPGYSKELTPVIVKNLQLTHGGFVGKAVIPNASKFVGEDYMVDAFIPGSQIVLNITDDFEQFRGATVSTFIINYIKREGTKNGMSLVCSAKELIKFQGELNLIELFKMWCDEGQEWKNVEDKEYAGKITGVINSSKKCGVFIEIPELSITGMVNTKPEELVKYKPHMSVNVKLKGFDEETYFEENAQQLQHVMPYEIEDGVLKKCNLKPILKFV